MMLPIFLPRFTKSSESSCDTPKWLVCAHLVVLLISLVITVALCVQAYSVLSFQKESHAQIEAANKATMEEVDRIMRDFDQYTQEHLSK